MINDEDRIESTTGKVPKFEELTSVDYHYDYYNPRKLVKLQQFTIRHIFIEK